jgi:predicted Zn-dependent protease
MKKTNDQILSELDCVLKNLTSTSVGRRVFLSSMSLLLASCATVDSDRRREGDNSGQSTDLTVDDERRLTQEVLPQMKKDYPVLKNSDLQLYISNLGKKVAVSNQLEGNPYNYSFSVVDVNYVNAFALPAGTVFVTAPLIAMADSEAELAGVIGHEIGHIKARHTAERMDKAKREQSNSWKYAIGGGLVGGLLGFGLGKLACPPKDDECLSKATQLGAAAGAGGGLLIQKYGFMANSREDEMEADRIGFKTSVGSGYHKDHVGLFYSKLLTMEKSKGPQDNFTKKISDALSTHPPSQERVQQMNAMAAEASNKSNSIISTVEFDRMKKLCIELAKSKPASS